MPQSLTGCATCSHSPPCGSLRERSITSIGPEPAVVIERPQPHEPSWVQNPNQYVSLARWRVKRPRDALPQARNLREFFDSNNLRQVIAL